MRRRCAWGLAVMLLCQSARAEPRPPCAGPRITLDPALQVQETWTLAVAKTRRIVGERDVDTCAAFDVSERRPGAVVRAELPDGRVTERSLSGPDELPKAVTALILLPPPSPIESPASVAAEARPQQLDPPARRESIEAPPNRPRAASKNGFELGLGPASRFGYDTRASLAMGAASFAQARVDDWLVGLAGRASQSLGRSGSTFPDWSAHRAFAAGLLLGRRLTRRRLELDAMIEAPIFAYERIPFTTVSTARMVDDDDPTIVRTTSHDQTLTYTSLAGGAVLRASLPLSSFVRAYVALDADRTFTRLRVTNTSTDASPTLPVWGAGLSLGLRWSVL